MHDKACGAKTEVYSRVVGYYRPVSGWNKGKQEEFKDRHEYDQKIVIDKMDNAMPLMPEKQHE